MFRTKSRGYATDLMIAAFDGDVSQGSGYLAARTPSCPAFWWGNFVLFSAPPRAEQVRAWEAIFDAEVGRVPGVEHRNLAWDTTDGDCGSAHVFVAHGYALSRGVFLMTQGTHPSPHHRTDAAIRPLETDADWQRVLHIQHASLTAQQDTPAFRHFQERQLGRSRRLVAMGFGRWFGAFRGEEMVATMGLVAREGLGRCQTVATLPSARRAGYCGTLVHTVCTYGFEHMGVREIGIMTDSDNAALRVYQSVGFEVREQLSSLYVSTTGRAAR